MLHNPVRCDVAEPASAAAAAAGVLASGRVTHGLVRCAARDKMLHVLALLRLNAVRRKALIFAPSADAAVRLRLFLERFGVRAATLHGELPANSRAHALAEFNKGLFDFMIATDDTDRRAAQPRDGGDGAAEGGEGEGEEGAAGDAKKGGRKGGKRDAEFGVMRGIDFKDVRTVINMDVPVRKRDASFALLAQEPPAQSLTRFLLCHRRRLMLPPMCTAWAAPAAPAPRARR